MYSSPFLLIRFQQASKLVIIGSLNECETNLRARNQLLFQSYCYFFLREWSYLEGLARGRIAIYEIENGYPNRSTSHFHRPCSFRDDGHHQPHRFNFLTKVWSNMSRQKPAKSILIGSSLTRLMESPSWVQLVQRSVFFFQ